MPIAENAQFKKHEKMIMKQAWRVAKTYGLDYDELCSDGYLLFVEALLRYDESMGKFASFLYYKLKGLADIHFRANKDVPRFDYKENIESLLPFAVFDSYMKKLEFQMCVESDLSEQAQQVLAYIFAHPDRRHTINSIMLHFRKKWEWSVKEVEMTLQEIKQWWACYQTA